MLQENRNIVIYTAVFVLSMSIGFLITGLIKSTDEGPDVNVPEDTTIVKPMAEVPFSYYSDTIIEDITRHGTEKGSNIDTLIRVVKATHHSGSTRGSDTVWQTSEIKELSHEVVSIIRERPAPMPSSRSDPDYKKEMTRDQFEQSLNNNDNNIIGRGIKINVRKLREKDKIVRDVTDVQEKIQYETWSRVKVVSLNYDESGKIVSATVEPVYPDKKNEED